VLEKRVRACSLDAQMTAVIVSRTAREQVHTSTHTYTFMDMVAFADKETRMRAVRA
jgi:hypothetical protein